MFKELYKNRLILIRMLRIRFNMLMYRMINRNNRNFSPDEAERELRDRIRNGKGCRVAVLLTGKGIGDAIAVSGFMHILKQHSCEVSIVCYDRLLGVLPKLFPYADKFIRVVKHDSIFKYFGQREDVDAVVDFSDPDVNFDHHKLKSLCALNCRNIIGFNQDLEHSGVPIPENPPRDFFSAIRSVYAKSFTNIENRPFLSRPVQVLRDYFGISLAEGDYRYYVDVDTATEKRVTEWLTDIKEQYLSRKSGEASGSGAAPRLVLINARASSLNRSLSAGIIDKTCEYLLSCSGNYLMVLMNIDPGELKQKAPEIIFNPFKSFEEVVMLIKHADLILSPDTSVVHVSAVYNKQGIFMYPRTKSVLGYNNDVVWSPVHENGLQVYFDPEPGAPNDLRDLKFEVLREALVSKGIV